MVVELQTRLITVANYARLKNVTTTWIYRLGKQGKVSIVEIDGVKFVDIETKKENKSLTT